MERKIIATAAFLGMLSIILGAFGAHSLKQVLTPEQLNTFEIGVRFQMYHALFLLLIGNIAAISQKMKKTILYLVIAGVLFFSGSLYLLATDGLTSINPKSIGFLTPIGGLLLIIAWFCLFVDFMRKKS